jgi:Flp pilus assembly protein TadD
VLANLGFIYLERGRDEDAEKVLRRAVSLDGKHFPAHYDLGRLLVRLKRYEEALPILEHASRLTSDDPGIHYQLFITYSRLKRKDDAHRELTQFKALEGTRKRLEGGMSEKDELPQPKVSVSSPEAVKEERPKLER